MDSVSVRPSVVISGVSPLDAPVRLPGDPAHPGALQAGADSVHPGGAAPEHGPAAAGPVRQLRHPARPRARKAGKRVYRSGDGSGGRVIYGVTSFEFEIE